MSKIFDILNREKGEISDVVRPMVESAPAMPASVAPAATVETQAPPVETVRRLSFRLPAPSPLLPFQKGQWRPSEQYRILRTKIVQHPKQPHVIVVSSPAPGDGKSVSAINMAGALSLKNEGAVLLLDGDLRKSAVHLQLGLPETPGLSELLTGGCSLSEAMVQAQDFPNFFILPAGKAVSNPVELLDSAAWQALLAKLREMFRYIILDSPPVGAVADYDLIQAACDGVVLVVRPDHTNRRLCEKALDNIPKAKFLGVLLNCVPDWKMAQHSGADYYYLPDEYAKARGTE